MKSILFKLYRPVQWIYRFVVPPTSRKKLEKMLFGVSLPKLRKKIIRYLQQLPPDELTNEQKEVLEYLKKNEFSVFPYTFVKKYSPDAVEVFLDDITNLHYVLLEGKRLYFKRNWSVPRIQTIFRNLLIEQDPDSPHRYLSSDFNVSKGDVLVDIGVAEGNFSLLNIEKVSRVFIFESDEEWIEALNATFAPWKEKVTIIHKWVSDVNDSTFVTLDKVFENEKIDFIKVDVDGFEAKLLKGSEQLIASAQNLKIALCTYHRQGDFEHFSKYLANRGFRLSTSKGYMLFYWGKIEKPYLRRGVLRAVKSSEKM